MKKSLIEIANQKWLEDKKPTKAPKQKRRIQGLLESQYCREKEWSGRAYKVVRG